MAKKSRRQTASTGGYRTFGREFEPDYSAVSRDLKRIGILAGSFLSILVILSFFL